MKKWSRALVVSLVAVGLSALSASAADVIIQPGSNPVVVQPQPGTVIVQPEPSASVVTPPAPVTVVTPPATTAVVPAQPWCAGTYAPGLGTNFGPCPGVIVQGR